MCPYQDQFADFLVHCWRTEFQHAYPITHHRAWHRWRAMPVSNTVEGWACDTLKVAAERWSWYEAQDTPTFGELSSALLSALRTGSDADVHDICLQIFKWGGVATKANDPSRVWVAKRARDGSLKARIRAAVALLQPTSSASLERFDDEDLLMNSAMTKLYAAADDSGEVVMYDSRVGAALGLLSRHFLEQRHMLEMPPSLVYYWGPARGQAKAQSRNPSNANYRYPQLPNGAGSSRARAEVSRRANWLLRDVRSRLLTLQVPTTSLQLERALFMVGYQVRRPT